MTRSLPRRAVFVALLVLASLGAAAVEVFVDRAHTVPVNRARAIDQRVDCATRLALGPWDDRND